MIVVRDITLKKIVMQYETIVRLLNNFIEYDCMNEKFSLISNNTKSS